MAINLTVKKFADLRKLSGESAFRVAPSWVGSTRLLVHKAYIRNAKDFMRDGAFSVDLVKAASGQEVGKLTDEDVEKMLGVVDAYSKLRATKLYLRKPHCKPSEGERVYVGEGESRVLLGVPERNLAFLEYYGDIYAHNSTVVEISGEPRAVQWAFMGCHADAYDSYNRAEPGGDLYEDLAACVRVLEAQNPNLKNKGKAVQNG